MLIALPLLLAASPAPAFSGADLADGRCLAAMALIADDKDKDLSQAGVLGTAYFMGKLKGRSPDLDIETLLRSIQRDVKANEVRYRQACAGEIGNVGAEMTKIGNALSADGI